MIEYTKTPWKIRKQDILGNEQNGYICSWSGRSADAHLIVAAVNACVSVNPDNPLAVAESIKDMYGDLIEADMIICELCKRLNPHHATQDNGVGCKSCEDRERRLKALARAEGKQL